MPPRATDRPCRPGRGRQPPAVRRHGQPRQRQTGDLDLTKIAADLYQTKLFARELDYDFFLSHIPDGVQALQSDQFDRAKMTRLFEAGAGRRRAVQFFDIPDLDKVRERRLF